VGHSKKVLYKRCFCCGQNGKCRVQYMHHI